MSAISKQALLVDNNSSFPNNNSGQITPSDLRAFNVNMITSLVDEITYTADSGSWNQSIDALETFTASQQPSFTALNSFTASQLTINSGVNLFTQSATQELDSLSAWTGSWEAWTSSINEIRDDGVLQGYSTRFFFNGLVSASIIANVGGPIANVTVQQDGTKLNTASFNAYTASSETSQSSFNNSITASVSQLLSFSSSLDTTFATDAQLNASSSTLQANIDTKLNTASFNSYTASITALGFATTGSNTFRGNETFEDAGGNASTLVPTSGSLMLVAKGFTSASAHLSASAGTFVNLIFKNSNTTPDTIISGSNNIFVNPSAPTAGFKRYIGTSNHYTHGNSVPQISGSMAWSPSLNGNILSHTQINSLTWRGPSSLSSGAGNVNHNIVMGGSMNLGTSAVNNFEKATAGVNINGNALFNGTFNQIANKTTLVNGINTSGNLIFGGQVNLNHISSSIAYNSNVTNGSTTVNNRFSPTGASPAILSPRTNTNTLYGTGHVINFDGTNVGATQGKSFNFNILAGTFLTASVPDGDACSVQATGMIGNGLIVTGSTLTSTFAGPDVANGGQGSMFVGRFNAQDGNKAKTAETIFAVGTGTSYANRKTGFLIDSGSNTFIEGSLTLTGSAHGNVVSMSITSQTASMDLSLGNFFALGLESGSTTELTATNIKPGQTINLLLTQPSVGTGSLSYNSTFKFPAGANYIATPISGSEDIVTLISYDATKLYATSINNLV
jgi:hypothetical protein